MDDIGEKQVYCLVKSTKCGWRGKLKECRKAPFAMVDGYIYFCPQCGNPLYHTGPEYE